MDQDRWQLIKACVAGALERASSARDAWLRDACGSDRELLAEAQSLIRAADLTGGFLSLSYGEDSIVPARDSVPDIANQCVRTIGHYELREWLGAGGMGEVFRARDLALGREAALTLLPRRFAPELRLRLMREAEASARVQHPAIATFYETGEEGGEAFIAMEYVRGRTLRRRLAEGPLPFPECLAIVRCVLEALEHAHAAGILHRDIKPENVMVTSSRAAKLLDFGLAKHLLAGPQPDEAPTGSGAITLATETRLAGTIGYMAQSSSSEIPSMRAPTSSRSGQCYTRC